MASLFSVLGQHRLQMRRELVLAIKAITQAEQLVSAIQPGLALVEVIAEEAQGLIRAQLGGQLAKVRQGEIADVLMGVVGQASTLGDAFLPNLVEAIVGGSPLVGGGTGAPVDLAPLEKRVDRLSERLDRQLGRLATGSALVGVAIIAAALVLAILPRPTDVLVGFDLVALALRGRRRRVPRARGARLAARRRRMAGGTPRRPTPLKARRAATGPVVRES